MTFVYVPVGPTIELDKYSWWWKKDSLFRYNKMMACFPYVKDMWDYRELCNLPDDFELYSDSGGFQTITLKESYEPVDVLRWQEHNANVGMMLDVPPPPDVTDFNIYKSYAERSLRNFQIAERNRSSDSLKLYKILHGEFPQELKYWWNLIKDISADGIGCSPRPHWGSSTSIVRPLSFLLSIGYTKNVHVFVAGGRVEIVLLTYLGKFFENLTMDCSTWHVKGVNKVYSVPYVFGGFFGFNIRFDKEFSGKLKELPCDCPICAETSVKELCETRNKYYSTYLIAMHNLYHYLKYVEMLNKLVDDEDEFFNYIRRLREREEILEAIKLIELSLKEGYESAFNKLCAKGKRLVDVFG